MNDVVVLILGIIGAISAERTGRDTATAGVSHDGTAVAIFEVELAQAAIVHHGCTTGHQTLWQYFRTAVNTIDPTIYSLLVPLRSGLNVILLYETTALHDLTGALCLGRAEDRLGVSPVPYSRPDLTVFLRCCVEDPCWDQRYS